MGKVKETIIDVNVSKLIFQVPDGLDRIPIKEIPECVEFIEKNKIHYLNYLDQFFPCEETNLIYRQDKWEKDWLCFLLNHRKGNVEVQELIWRLGEYVALHYDELMS